MENASPLAILLNYGVLGIIVVLLISGWVRTKPEVDGLKEQIEDLKGQLAERDRVAEAMRVQLTQQTLPAMARSAQVLETIPQTAGDEKQLVKELQALISQLKDFRDDEG